MLALTEVCAGATTTESMTGALSLGTTVALTRAIPVAGVGVTAASVRVRFTMVV